MKKRVIVVHASMGVEMVGGTIAGALPSVNDPSAGSPTETLLRLLLPLNEQV